MDRRLIFALAGALATAVAALAYATLLGAGPSELSGNPMPRACARARDGEAASCGRCHPQIHAQWRASGHAAAFDNPIFQAEYTPHPSPECAACHAAGQARAGHASHDGVDCGACHGAALERGAPRWRVCASCHQFHFPGPAPGGIYDPADAQQNTLSEWLASDAARAGRDCIDCHMSGATTAGHMSHRILGASDPALAADALTVSASLRRDAGQLVVSLRLGPGDVGHSVPTGDMFRRLRVEASTVAGASSVRWLGQVFAEMPASSGVGFRLRPVLDTRIPAPGAGDPVGVELRLPDGEGPVLWSVELHRLRPAVARERGLDPATTSTLLASGEVELGGSEPMPRPAPSP